MFPVVSVIQNIFLEWTLMILEKLTFSWLNPHHERFATSTKPIPIYVLTNAHLPTYMVVLEKPSTSLNLQMHSRNYAFAYDDELQGQELY